MHKFRCLKIVIRLKNTRAHHPAASLVSNNRYITLLELFLHCYAFINNKLSTLEAPKESKSVKSDFLSLEVGRARAIWCQQQRPQTYRIYVVYTSPAMLHRSFRNRYAAGCWITSRMSRGYLAKCVLVRNG